jgi:hypothetical protein
MKFDELLGLLFLIPKGLGTYQVDAEHVPWNHFWFRSGWHFTISEYQALESCMFQSLTGVPRWIG